MKRTTIFLDESLERRLKQRARREGKSFAQVVREAMAQFVARPVPGARPLPSFFGIAPGGEPDLSERVDEYLWKDPHA
jgi:Ribbon-helix-helix protein, copG family